jgi:hypothetical protein
MERGKIHHSGKVRLKATTLLETIVASIVFLIVFGMAMTSAVNLRRMDKPDWAHIETDFNAMRTLAPEDGHVYEYDWGDIETSCRNYREIPGLVDVQATISLKDGRKFAYRYLYYDGQI